jgi:hypothetical protein
MARVELPIACSLDARSLAARLDEIADVGRSSLVDAALRGRGAVLRFRRDTNTAERLRAIVAAEAECCAFLAMDIREQPEELVLTVDSPPGAELVVEELVAAFAATSR